MIRSLNTGGVQTLVDGAIYEELLALPLLSSDWNNRMRVLHGRLVAAQQRPA